MQLKYMFATIGCACALMCALASCGGSGGPAQSWEHKAFTGTWNLVEMSDGGEVTGNDELKLMNSLGMQVTLALGTDSELSLDTLGKIMEGTWEATSETEGTAFIDKQELPMEITEGKLVMEQGGDKLVFDKVSDEAANDGGGSSSAASQSSAASSSSAESSGNSEEKSGKSSSAASSSASAASKSASSASSESEKGSR